MKSEDDFNFARFKQALIMVIIFWVIEVGLWQTTGRIRSAP